MVERSQVDAAVTNARRAVELATQEDRGERVLTYARALDRADQLDSAQAAYHRASELLPPIRDWLLLRAAGVSADSDYRHALYLQVKSGAAAARVPWTEALALDRTGDKAAAARRYTALGANLAAAKAKLSSGDTALVRDAREQLLAALTPELSIEDSEAAIALFDRWFPNRTGAEELRIARRAAATNQLERAARGYAAAGLERLTDRDRFTYATALSRLGRFAEALPLFDQVRAADLKGDAAYQRARVLLRSGQTGVAMKAFAEVADRFPADSEPAAAGLYLAGDLRADRGFDDSARAFFLRAGAAYPSTPYGRRASFQAALIAFVDSHFQEAAAEFDRLAAAPSSDESLASTYWSGRALAAAGDSAGARKRWTAVLERSRDSYYSVLAARRLDTTFMAALGPAERGERAPPDDGLHNAELLSRLGLKVEARFELESFAQQNGHDAESLETAAGALANAGWYGRSSRLAQRALDRGASFDRRLAELVYPLPFRPVLVSGARAAKVDPALVAGVIRQESLFDPEARSSADARGLMQVLPSVGAELARSAGLLEWDPVLLYQPDVNLDFGIEHLAGAITRLEWPARALAAYNAGADRVARWQAIRGVREDPEIFIERIPFAETRDYVRKVLRNQAIYRVLYPADDRTS
jgi:soluble lytic murein transglycosylase